MNIITIATLITSTVCSTFGAIYLGIWFRQRTRLDYLMFASGTFSVAAFSVFELAGMHATTPAEYGTLVRWSHLPGWGMIVFLPWFAYFYMRAGRRWLLWSITILRTLVLILNFILTPNINQREVISVTQSSFLGEPISIAQTVPNPWMVVAQFSLLLALVFFVDATITAWRRGDRRRALAIGGTTTFFFTMNMVMAVLILWGFVHWPYMLSVFFTAMIIAMAYELTSDILRSVRLARTVEERDAQLRENEQHMTLSASAANVGVWTRSLGEKTIWASDKWHELFAFAPRQPVTFDDHLQRIHPDDRQRVETTLRSVGYGGREYETEYRIVLPDGETRWIGSSGQVEFSGGEPVLLRGASVDITKRKLAEQAAHDLSGRLIDAQETERSRLARELHDGLSQSLALLSIQLEVLGTKPREPAALKKQVGDLTSEIQRLSSDVHRMSHELHPAKLDQLGLESALRGFCREVADAHSFAVDFDAAGIPRLLPDDISLCLYRVTQESLQNVAKHSGASAVNVNINMADDEICLTVSDNGSGFDLEDAATDSLGLVSMGERIRLVHGTFSLESNPGSGTRIHVCLPFSPS